MRTFSNRQLAALARETPVAGRGDVVELLHELARRLDKAPSWDDLYAGARTIRGPVDSTRLATMGTYGIDSVTWAGKQVRS